MSNLNINQKVAMATLKHTEAKRKDSHLSESELRLRDFTETIKPNLSEDQAKLLEKYHSKVSALGIKDEINTYEILKKFDWNEKILDNYTDVLIQKKEEATLHDDWVTVGKQAKPQAKPQHHKKAREAEDIRRRPQEGGFEAEGEYKDRNRTFRSKARRGQSVDPSKKNYQEYDNNEYGRGGQREYRRNRRQQENPEEEQFDREKQNKEFRDYKDRRDRRDNQRDQRDQNQQKGGRRGRNQKEEVVTMYVKKGEQQEKTQDQQPRGRKGQEDQQHNKRGRQERVIYVKKGDSENPDSNANANAHANHANPKPKSNRKVRNAYLEDEGHAWQNDVDEEEVIPQEAAPQGKTQDSPSRHYNEHNIHEFFKSTPNKNETAAPTTTVTTSSAKKETNTSARKEQPKKEAERPKKEAERPKKEAEKPKRSQPKPAEERSSPVVPRVENDHISQTAQKPLVENPTRAPKEKVQVQAQPESHVHAQPIGSNRPQTQPAHPELKNAQASTTTTQTTQQTQPTQPTHQENLNAQQQQQFGGFPQYLQQPYMMPQQAFFNPYMQFYQQQQQQQQPGHKDQQQQQTQPQPQGSYPPGFNPQDMASMYQLPQVPFILIPQPNGTTILQPMYQMMPPQMMNQEIKTPEDQQKMAQNFYQFPMTLPMQNPFGYYQNDNANTNANAGKPQQQQQQNQTQKFPPGTHYDNKNTTGQQQQQPNASAFFNFGPNNDTEHKKNQQGGHGGYQQQAGGYPFMPYMMPTNAMGGQYPGQQYQQKEGQGHSGWK